MASAAPLPDAVPWNWVDAYAPPPLRPWLKLGRFDRPTGIWLLMLPGWQGIALADAMQGRWPSPVLLGLFFLGAALMRTAGCAFNDVVDRDIDAKVARTAARPVASGQITVRQAWAFIVGCSLVSLVILLLLPPVCWLLGIASLGLVAAYPFMKRITWWPQAWLGLTFNWGALMGYAAAFGYGVLLLPPMDPISARLDILTFQLQRILPNAGPALLLYAGGVFWTLGYDTIYAIQDLEDDALAGVKSSARRLGRQAPRAIAGFYLVAIACAFFAGATAGLGLMFDLVLLAYAIHLGLQARRVRIEDGALALRLFKSNTWAGLILFAALALGVPAAFAPQ
jgi:4-hydroxybenzoate polyprenyltransferase